MRPARRPTWASRAQCLACMGITLAASLAAAQTDGADSRDRWHEVARVPEPRTIVMSVLDCENQQVVLVGGWGGAGYFNDVWALRPGNGSPHWVPIEPIGGPPLGRGQHSVVLDREGHSLYVFGGRQDFAMGDVWRLTLTAGAETWTQISPTGPQPVARHSASAVCDPVNRRMIIFGGKDENGQIRNDAWALDFVTHEWTELFPSGETPSPRRDAAGVYDPVDHRMVIFGGWNPSVEFLNETWALSLDSGAEEWERLNPSGPLPAIRSGHAATYDWVDHRMLIYGGWTYPPFYYYGDVHALDLSTLTWSQISPGGSSPEARRTPIAEFFFRDGIKGMVIFGGDQSESSYYNWFNDTHILVLD